MIKRLTIALLGLALAAPAQLHLITGSVIPSSGRRYATTLFRIADDGTLKLVDELAPKDLGVTGITISYDAGIALILSKRMIVVDLENAKVVKSCPSAMGPQHSIWVYAWLLNIPSRGAVLVEDFANSQDDRTTLMGTLTDPAITCDKSRFTLDPTDLRYVSVLGRTLIADAGGADYAGLFTLLDATGAIKGSESGVSFGYGYQVPPTELETLQRPSNAGLMINNAQIIVLELTENNGGIRFLAVRKKDNTWHRVPATMTQPLDASARAPLPIMRGFGHFIAMAETLPKDTRNHESAGSSEWRKTEGKAGPEIEYFFGQNARVIFPGRLHVYDVDTDRAYTIQTDQGDSEILLIEDNTVYYRASDRLFSATINGNEIGRPRLLATDEAIRDAHWAFIKH